MKSHVAVLSLLSGVLAYPQVAPFLNVTKTATSVTTIPANASAPVVVAAPIKLNSTNITAPAAEPTSVAGVTLLDTPLIKAAKAFLKSHSSEWVYHHAHRTWALSLLVAKKQAGAWSKPDAEVQALAALFANLGFDPTRALQSNDGRYEVDGANAAWDWVEAAVKNRTLRAGEWDDARKQLLWDAIALHTTPTIASFKESEVRALAAAWAADFQGTKSDPTKKVTQAEFDAVKKAFPVRNLAAGYKAAIVDQASQKYTATVDTFQEAFGTQFLATAYKPTHFVSVILGATA